MEPGTGPLRVCAQGALRSLGLRRSGQAPDAEEGEGAQRGNRGWWEGRMTHPSGPHRLLQPEGPEP